MKTYHASLRLLSGWSYRHLVKPILFRIPADHVHEWFLALGRLLGSSRVTRAVVAWLWRYESPRLRQDVAGLSFANPVGLSAGFDYRAFLVRLAPDIGFGLHSIGTITALPYAGNPRPRIDRLPKSRSLLVNKGFKNEGVQTVLPRLACPRERAAPRGVSISATNREYPSYTAMLDDLVEGFRQAECSADFDYYELNVSCPNLVNLRNLGEQLASPVGLGAALDRLASLGLKRPVFIKLPLERTETEMRALIDVAVPYAFITGFICSNLAKDRSNPAFDPEEIARAGQGNFSGKPTQAKSNAMLRFLYGQYHARFIFIGTGGIFTAEDAYAKILAGASLVQLVTGLVYQGPQVVGDINAGLAAYLERDGYASVSEAVGARADR